MKFIPLVIAQVVALVALINNTEPNWITVPIFVALIFGISYYIFRAVNDDIS